MFDKFLYFFMGIIKKKNLFLKQPYCTFCEDGIVKFFREKDNIILAANVII